MKILYLLVLGLSVAGHYDLGAGAGASRESVRSRLETACLEGNLTAVTLLLQNHPAELNSKGSDGATLLHCAAANGHLPVVLLLLEKGIPVDTRDNHGATTALHIAAMKGQSLVVALLLKWGAMEDRQDSDGWTPLHWAAMHNHKEVVALLLEAGADRCLCNNEGEVAVDRAPLACFERMAQLLSSPVKIT